MSNDLYIAFAFIISTCLSTTFGQQDSLENSTPIAIPQQSSPPRIGGDAPILYSFDSQTNLVSLLGDIRKLVTSKDFEKQSK